MDFFTNTIGEALTDDLYCLSTAVNNLKDVRVAEERVGDLALALREVLPLNDMDKSAELLREILDMIHNRQREILQ